LVAEDAVREGDRAGSCDTVVGANFEAEVKPQPMQAKLARFFKAKAELTTADLVFVKVQVVGSRHVRVKYAEAPAVESVQHLIENAPLLGSDFLIEVRCTDCFGEIKGGFKNCLVVAFSNRCMERIDGKFNSMMCIDFLPGCAFGRLGVQGGAIKVEEDCFIHRGLLLIITAG
jgi:hypothetical protein